MEPAELSQYTVKIKAGEQVGTGFWVAPRSLLTCAHVVRDSRGEAIASIEVWWQDCPTPYQAVVDGELFPQADLALLKLEAAIEHPCVCLDDSLENGDRLYAFGYTDDYPQGEPRDFIYTGLTGDSSPLMTFRDEQVQPGFSGAPLLNRRTGKICGSIKRSRDIYANLGGRGVPAAVIFTCFPQLKPLAIAPNPFNHRTGRIDEPRWVFGREKEVNRIFEILNCGSSVAIVGEPEIGKSSLLKVIEDRATSQLKMPRKPIYLDLGNVWDEEDFYVAFCDTVGIDVCKGFRLSRELQKHQLLLILDNVEKMAWDGFTNQIRSQIRALAEGKDAPLRLVIATPAPLNRLFPDSSMVSPFDNICLEEQLLGWDEKTVRNLILSCLEKTSIRFSEAEITDIIRESQGHPKQVVQRCYQTYSNYLQ